VCREQWLRATGRPRQQGQQSPGFVLMLFGTAGVRQKRSLCRQPALPINLVQAVLLADDLIRHDIARTCMPGVSAWVMAPTHGAGVDFVLVLVQD